MNQIQIIEQTDANMITLDQVVAQNPNAKIFIFGFEVNGKSYKTFIVDGVQ